MKIAYITMQFPYPSETFASSDVRLLREKAEVSVHGLRFVHPDAPKMLIERDLEGLTLTHNRTSSLVAGLGYGLKNPHHFLSLLSYSVKTNIRKPSHLFKSLLLLPRVLEIFSWLERERPDVVHIYWGHYPALVGYLVERYLPGTVVTLSLAAYDLHMQYGGTKQVAQQAHAVRTLTQANVAQIERVFGVPAERVEVIYDSLDIARGQRALVGKAKIAKRVLTAGRLIEAKGMFEVLEVFAAVLKQHPEASLVVLGDGDKRAELEALSRALGLEHAVTFKGHVNHDTVFEEMAVAEIFLFLSKSERLPNVVKEAMLSGCVCVVSDTVGIAELIPDERYGFVVPAEDIEAATACVLRVLESGFDRASLLENAKTHVAERFSIASSLQQYLDIWKGLLAKKRPVPSNFKELTAQKTLD